MICCILSLVAFAAFLYVFFKLDANPLLAFYERYLPNKDKLRGKTCWVVGSSTGIGEELACQLAELNCKLALTSTTESKLQEVKQNCIKRSNNSLKSDDILVLAYDISDFKKNDEALAKILQKFGHVDVLINNAARILVSSITDDDLEEHRKLFDINYFANVYIAKMMTRHWLSIKSKGVIMGTSSIGAYFDLPFYSAYINSKKALTGFYRDLSMQHDRDGIKVVTIFPGPVDTDLAKKSIEVNSKKAAFNSSEKMDSHRCAELSIIATANQLSESWTCIQPWLILAYLSDSFHYQLHYLFKFFNLIKAAEKRYHDKKSD